MALPHSINITSGGTGADPGEMFFGCQVDRIDGPPGFGSRAFSPGEDALSKNFNRSAFALAENDEYLGDILDKQELAYNEVGALAAFTGNSIDIDPSGAAAGDINYTGSLYLGDAGWLVGQEALDTLFQILDENYNEVTVDGVEVKVTGLVGGAVGDGFVNVLVTLNLNKTLPAGNYRVAYGRGTTYAGLPAYALIRADVRGLQEASAEVQRKTSYVCGPTTSESADYRGANAIIDAITDLGGGDGFTLFIQPGTYNFPTAVVDAGVKFLGTAEDGDVILTIAADTNFSGARQRLSGLKFSVATGVDIGFYSSFQDIEQCIFEVAAPDGTEQIYFEGSYQTFRSCYATGMFISCNDGGHRVFSSSEINGEVRTLLMDSSSTHHSFTGMLFRSPGIGHAVAEIIGDTEQASFTSCKFVGHTGNTDRVLEIAEFARGITFKDCYFQSTEATGQEALYINPSSGYGHHHFDSCTFTCQSTSYRCATVDCDEGVQFTQCSFTHSGVQSVGVINFDGGDAEDHNIIMDGCRVYVAGVCTGTDVKLHDTQVRDLRIEYGVAYDGASPALEAVYSDLLDVVVIFKSGTDQTNLTGDSAVHIWTSSRVIGLQMENMRNRWQMPAVHVQGASGYQYRSIVERLSLTPESSPNLWFNYDTPFIVMDDFSTLRDTEMSGAYIEDAGAPVNYNMAIVGTPSGGSTPGIVLDNCRFLVDAPNCGYLLNLIRFGIGGGSVSYPRITNCYLRGGDETTPLAYNGTAGQGSCCWFVDANQLLFQGNYVENGLISGGIAPSETTYSTAVYLGASCERARIMDNEIAADIPNAPSSGQSKVLYHAGAGTFGGVKAEATLIVGNIFRNPQGVNVPLIGNPNGAGNAVFDGDPANNNVYATE